MDPLSLTASIIAVIQVSEEIAKICKEYVEGVKDYPKELLKIHSEIKALSALFETLKLHTDNRIDDSGSLRRLLIENPDGPVAACQAATEELKKLLPNPRPEESQGDASGTKRRKLDDRLCLARLAWPFHSKKAYGLLNDIARHKATISVALNAEISHNVQQIKQDVQGVKTHLSDQEKKSLYDWLWATDTTINHRAALSLHEEGTSAWFFRCREWQQFLAGDTHSLWIHGIPGAGKTILISKIVETLENCAEAEEPGRVAVIFYYCYHGHNQDETIPLLKHILRQLCLQSDKIPQEVLSFFKKTGGKGHADANSLKKWISLALNALDKVFVVVDALDECQKKHWATFLKEVKDLATKPEYSKIRLLTSSREYPEIQEIMTPGSLSISMSDNDSVAADIKLYIKARLEERREFKRWSRNLRGDIQKALEDGAKGMFRWVVCQLDVLRRIGLESKIRQAIKSLPQTLDETYERIFALIEPEYRDLVRHTLFLLVYHDKLDALNNPENLDGSTLIESYDTKQRREASSSTNDTSFITGDLIKESCGCLVTFLDQNPGLEPDGRHDPFFCERGRCRCHPTQPWCECNSETIGCECLPDRCDCIPGLVLAHYTVREFLESSRLSPSCKFFRLEDTTIARYVNEQIRDTLIDLGRHPIRIRHEYVIELHKEELRVRQVREFSRFSCYCWSAFRAWFRLDILEEDLRTFAEPDLGQSDIATWDKDFLLDVLDGSKPHFKYIYWLDPCYILDQEDIAYEHAPLFSPAWCPNSLPDVLFNSFLRNSSETFWKLFRVTSAEVITKEPLQVCLQGLKSVTDCIGRNCPWTMSEPLVYVLAASLGAFPRGYGIEEGLMGCMLHCLTASDIPSSTYTRIMMYFLWGHAVQRSCEEDQCELSSLLRLGAEADTRRWSVTPLQVAAACLDLEAAEALLQANANPNNTGNPNGETLYKDNLFGPLNELSRKSPLNIVRMGGDALAIYRQRWVEDKKAPWKHYLQVGFTDQEQKGLEKLLISRSARDFVVGEPDPVEPASGVFF